MVARLLAEPCSRWEPGEVLDLAAVMLMSRHWPEPARQIGGSIALRFLNSRSGRGQCARHLALLGSSPDMHDLLKFAKWHRQPSKDTKAPPKQPTESSNLAPSKHKRHHQQRPVHNEHQ